MLTIDRVLCCPLCRVEVGELSPNCSQCGDRCPSALQDLDCSAQPYSILDLTPDTLADAPVSQPLRTRLFQTQAIAYAYERVLPALWALGLRQAGIEREGSQVVNWFSDRLDPGNSAVAIDLSCGTGIITRRLLRDTSMNVIAIDYSEEMLGELQARCKEECIDPGRLALVRGDATVLPLQPNSVDAIYSGAAMHCWPNAEATFKQIHAALKPQGKLYLTTFLKPLPSLVFHFFSPHEIRQIAEDAGFPDNRLQLVTSGIYATLTATKDG